MADELINPIDKFEDLVQALNNHGLLESWDKSGGFRGGFLVELAKAIKNDRAGVKLGPDKVYDVDGILEFLGEYFRDEGTDGRLLRNRLPIWGEPLGLTIDLDDPIVAGQLRDLTKLEYQNSRQNPKVIDEAITIIDKILQPATAAPPAPADEILTRLTNQDSGPLRTIGNAFTEIKRFQSDLRAILQDYDRSELERQDSIKSRLEALPPDEKKTKQAQVESIQQQTEKELHEALQAFFRENWTDWLEQDDRLKPFTETVTDNQYEKEDALAKALAQVFVDHYQPSLPSAAMAASDAEVWLGKWLSLIAKQIETLQKQQTELRAQYKQQLKSRLQAVFAPIIMPGLGEGAAEAGEQPEEEAPDKTKTATTAKTQLAALFARLIAIEDFQTKRDALESLVNTVSDIIEEKTGLFNLGDLQSLLEFELDRRAADANITPADFQTWAQTTVVNLTAAAADFIPEEEAPPLEKPTPTPPGLVTPPPEGAKVISEEDGKRSVGELLQAQQLLVTQGLIELRQNLKQAGLNDLQIDEIVARNRETVSQQIWLEFLQRGGLAGDLKFAEMANIWSGVVAQNTQRILVEVGRQNTPAVAGLGPADPAQVARLKLALEKAGLMELVGGQYEIDRILANLDVDSFQQLVEISNKTGRSPEERRAAIFAILQKNGFAETDAHFEANFLANANDPASFLGFLQRQLAQVPPILNPDQQRRLTALLEGDITSAKNQTDIQQILIIVLAKKYPPEVILHLNPAELGQIYEFLARQQKAMAMLAQQLAGRAGFINPFHPPGGRNLEVARAATVTEAEAESQARDTLTLELTLTIAFTGDQGGQNVNVALAIQQFYADPRQGLLVLANNLGQAAAEPGAPVPEGGQPPITPAAAGQLVDLQRQNFAALAQRQQQAAAARQAAGQQALMMAILSSGGNPALLAKKFLTDPQAREALGGFAQQNKTKILLAIGGGNLPQAVGLLGVAKIASDILTGITNIFGGGANAIFQGAAGFLGGLTGGGAVPTTTAGAIGAETGAAAANATFAASNSAIAASTGATGNIINSTFATAGNFLTSTSTALTPVTAIVAAVLGPMAFAIVLTFIVFSVIAGSLNQLPTGLERGISAISANLPGLSRSGCWPVDGHITDLEHPANRVVLGGTAIDIGAKLGKPIYSPFAGEARARYVADRGKSNYGYGLFVDLRTTDGFRVIFAHMSGFRKGVTAGQKFTVAAGEVIGFIGSTGLSTGPHLHYETIGVNIFNLLPVGRSQLQISYPTSTAECSQTSDEEPVSTPSGATSTVE